MAEDVWSLKQVIEILTLRQEELFAEADQIANEFWEQHREENAKQPYSNRGRVGLRVRRRRGGVQIEWFVIQVKSNGGTTIAKHIKRGKRAKVPRKHYEHHCQDWELPIVEATEERLAPIRRKLNEIGRNLTGIKALMRLYGEAEEDDLEAEPGESEQA